jgi:hypothetical protein
LAKSIEAFAPQRYVVYFILNHFGLAHSLTPQENKTQVFGIFILAF